ncbi:MAG: hypothetical protein GY793_10730, partial [Proteobacteria bacterium]|nr:hypothetical protein [Pseudomonadota bacterium]
EWTLDDAEVYLKEHGLEDKPWDLLNRGIMEDVDLNFCKFWACAIQIKKLFFKQYPTVKKWIEKNIKFAHENGYLPSAHGVYRRLPQLLYVGKDGFRSKVKNLENISCNTSVQNFESALMQEVVIQLNSYIKENNLESRIVGAVHDSVVLYLKRSEVQLLARKAKEIFEEDRPENNGIPMELDIEIADPLKGEFWGFGKEINIEEYTA